jgi:N-methylhydantoinase B
MRRAIREIPNGTYSYQATIDGFDEPVTIAVSVQIDDDELGVDFTGTSPENERGINSVSNYTISLASYALKCMIDPLTPKNEGAFRPFRKMNIPEGSILNPRRPAPTFGRSLVGHVVTSALFGALAEAIPERVLADSGSCPGIRPHFLGTHNGRPFSFVLFANGGMGARATLDGLSCTGFPTNANCASMEVMESIVPLRCLKQELRPDSGGAGRMRGGLGLELIVEYTSEATGMLGMMSERKDHPAFGLFGGQNGMKTVAMLNDADAPQKGRAQLHQGDLLLMRYPGGGGYGDPAERDRRLVDRDLAYGYITREAAENTYGRTAANSEV